MHIVLDLPRIIDCDELTRESYNVAHLGEEIVERMALSDRGHNSGNATNPGRNDPRGQVADIDDLHESVGGCRRENTTAASQPSRPVPESVARVTEYNDSPGRAMRSLSPTRAVLARSAATFAYA